MQENQKKYTVLLPLIFVENTEIPQIYRPTKSSIT